MMIIIIIIIYNILYYTILYYNSRRALRFVSKSALLPMTTKGKLSGSRGLASAPVTFA